VEIAGRTFAVTGGTGFVGSHLVDALVAADARRVVVFDATVQEASIAETLTSGKVEIVQGDVRDPEGLKTAFAGADGVFHLAVLPLGPTIENPRLGLEVNVVGSYNVFDAAQQVGAQKVVFSSASSVYGDTDETMDESHPLDARTMYGASKIAAEYILRAVEDDKGLPYVTLRYMNVYGPRQTGGLVMAVIRRAIDGQSPSITGDGSQSFDFVHVKDVAAANVAAMASSVSREEFNVGSGTEASAREIAEKIIEITGSPAPVEYQPDVRVLMRRRVGSNEKALRLLGWKAGWDLDRGLRDTIDWVRANR